MPKGITDLAPLLGRMSGLFVAQLCKCHKTSPLCPPTTVLLRKSVTTATTTAFVVTQLQWKPPESSKDERRKGSKE